MNDLGKQICRCIVGACDETCKYYDADKACCVGYEKIAEQAEKAFAEYESYKDLEEQGKLLKLPCLVGDTYFCIDDGSYPNEWEFVNVQQIISVMDKIGKTIFLTRKEAEVALKEL